MGGISQEAFLVQLVPGAGEERDVCEKLPCLGSCSSSMWKERRWQCLWRVYYELGTRLRALPSYSFHNCQVSLGILFLFTEEEKEAQGKKMSCLYG